MSDIFLQFEERINRINRLFILKEAVFCKDGAIMYSDIAEQIHLLQVLVTKMKVILEHEKKNFARAQVIA